MQPKILSRRTPLIVLLWGFVFFLILFLLLFFFTSKSSTRNGSTSVLENNNVPLKQETSVAPDHEVSFGFPMRLEIPKIEVDAAIEYVGRTSDGAMEVTESLDNVAWFKLGQRPGEIGSAVIAGHYGWKNGKASVFNNLSKLRKGDELSIEDDRGAMISFIVRKSRSYEPEADASEVFSSSDGKPHLNLITCKGWDEDSKSFFERLVVFADKE